MVRWCFHFLNSVDVLSATSLQTYHLCRGSAPRSLSWWLTTSWPQRLCKDENYHRPKRGCQIHSKASTRRAWYEESLRLTTNSVGSVFLGDDRQIQSDFHTVLGTFLVSSKGSELQPCPFNWALHWSWAPQPIERTWRRKAVANSFLIRGSKLLLVGGWTTYPWNVGQFLAWNSQCSTYTHTYIYICKYVHLVICLLTFFYTHTHIYIYIHIQIYRYQ